MRKMQKQQGFTIIELVVVILLLGILTATALPRFMDVTEEAHDAAVSGVVGGLSTGVGLFRAQWFGKGQPASGNIVPGFGNGTLKTNASGYPIGTTAAGGTVDTSQSCFEVFNLVLQGGAPTLQSVAATAGALTSAMVSAATPITADYVVKLNSSPGGEVCEYAYVGQYQASADGNIPVISFNTNSGDVILTPAL